MSYWKEKWGQHYEPVFDRTLINGYTNYLRLGFVETKDVITKNVLKQLGYDIKEVVDTKGECVIHHIVWFFSFEQVEYLQVDGKVVGEVRLVNDNLSYKCEGKVYG